MTKEPTPQWSHIRKRLLLLEQKELIAQIKDLFALSDENRRFLQARFAQVPGQFDAVLAEYKQQIVYCFFGERGFSDDLPRLREARRLVRGYQKATKDTSGSLDLMLHYVETGTEFTKDYGDIDEPFYNSLESMLDDFCSELFKAPDAVQLFIKFHARVADLKEAASGIGWGYGDTVQMMIDDLESRFDEEGSY